MRKEPFRLQRVWEVSRLTARARLGEWARWQARAEQARAEAAALEERRRAAEGELRSPGAPIAAAELAARWRELEVLRRHCRSAQGRAAVLEREAEQRLAAALAARRDEQAYERLHARHQERQRQAWQRAEQARLDEAAARFAR